MEKVTKSRKKITAIILLPFLIGGILSLWWFVEPWYYVAVASAAEAPLYEGQKVAINKLISMGPRAVDPILSEIKADGGYSIYSDTLRKIGQPAKDELIRRIPVESKSRTKLVYIYVLQYEFGDFRFMHIMVDNISASNVFVLSYINNSLQQHNLEHPHIIISNHEDPEMRVVNPEFISWCKNKFPPPIK